MGKPTKYTLDTTKKILDAIRGGFTVKMACAVAEVTDMTLSRWRRQHSDFDAAFKKATDEQTWYGRKALKRAGVRVMRENLINTHKTQNKPSEGE